MKMIAKLIFLPFIILFSISLHSNTHQTNTTPYVNIYTEGNYRYVDSNGIPKTHGQFPNAHNPNSIQPQNYHFRMPLHPKVTGTLTKLQQLGDFGVALDGVPFDPNTAEWWQNDANSGWHYTAMAEHSEDLGLDENHAHVQPNGAYHYHGLPIGLFNTLTNNQTPTDMVMIGYAADGFPIYGIYGYKDPKDPHSGLVTLSTSYQLKTGTRPSGPRGTYDGRFMEDYQYVEGSGDLDQCNGRYGITPEYPNGTYYYIISDDFPFISRYYKGAPDPSFVKHRPSGNSANENAEQHEEHYHRRRLPPPRRRF